MPASTSGRRVRFAKGLIASTSASPASMSTPAPRYDRGGLGALLGIGLSRGRGRGRVRNFAGNFTENDPSRPGSRCCARIDARRRPACVAASADRALFVARRHCGRYRGAAAFPRVDSDAVSDRRDPRLFRQPACDLGGTPSRSADDRHFARYPYHSAAGTGAAAGSDPAGAERDWSAHAPPSRAGRQPLRARCTWLRETWGIELQLDLASVKQLIADNLDSAQALTLKLLSGLKAGGTVVLGILINLVMIPVVMFYLLRDWNRIIAHVDGLLPRRWLPRVRIIALEIDGVLAEFLRGQLAVMGVLAVYYVVGLTLAGLQFALPIGILTGLLVFIPYVGFGLGLILGVLAALLQWSGWPGFMAVVAVYGIGQLLENYVLVPFLVGDRIGLHPLAVIFALLAFGELFGFAGVLLALPVSAALLVGLRHLRATYIDSDLYR